MKLFVFGLGYSAQALIARGDGVFSQVSGTVRCAEKAASLRAQSIAAYAYAAGAGLDPDLATAIADADCIVQSIAPDADHDAVLADAAPAIARGGKAASIQYLSTIGVYGDQKGAWVDHTQTAVPGQLRSIQRLAAEQQWRAFGTQTGIAVIAHRIAGIYGPGRNVLRQIANGTARRIIKPGQVFNRIHVADIAGFVLAAIANPAAGAIHDLADDEPSPPQDVIEYAAALMGRAPPPALDFATADLTAMARSFYGETKRVDNRRSKAALGLTLRFPNYRAGLDALFAAGEGRA